MRNHQKKREEINVTSGSWDCDLLMEKLLEFTGSDQSKESCNELSMLDDEGFTNESELSLSISTKRTELNRLNQLGKMNTAKARDLLVALTRYSSITTSIESLRLLSPKSEESLHGTASPSSTNALQSG